jgi:hypothetical protein
MARLLFLLRKFAGTSLLIVAIKGPSGLSDMTGIFANFGFEPIKFLQIVR